MEATLHIRLDSVLRGELEQIAQNQDEKLSKIIRQALEEFALRKKINDSTKILLDRF